MEGGSAIETQENDRDTGTLQVGNGWCVHSFLLKFWTLPVGYQPIKWEETHHAQCTCVVYNKQLSKVLAI